MRAWIEVGREKPMSARARSRRESRIFENVENEVTCPERRASGAIAQIDNDEGQEFSKIRKLHNQGTHNRHLFIGTCCAGHTTGQITHCQKAVWAWCFSFF